MSSTKKVRGLLVEIGGDTTKLQTALKNVDSKTSSLSKELRGVNTLLKFDPSNTILLSQKTKLLSDSVEETENRLKALKQAQQQLDKNGIDKNTSDYRDLQREILLTTRKVTDLKNETTLFSKTSQKLEDFSNKANSVAKGMDKVGNALTVGLTLPIAALGTYSTKAAIDFETAFAGVKKTVEATEDEYQKLSDSIINMSKELPATTTEISAVAEAAGQLGIQKDSIISFTKTMIDLGKSTNLSANDAATQLARFANIMQMSQKDFDRLGSTIVALGNNFATTESEIVSMGLRLAGAGKQVGMSEDQIMSFATALSSVGIEAEMGGSAFSKVMLKIESDVATNSKRLSDWARVSNMSVSEFKRLWEQDAASALSKFVQGLGNLEQKGENATVTLASMELSEVRLRDTLLRAASANNVFSDALDLGSKSWQENTALTDEANKRYETTESQMAIAKNNVNALAISLGKSLLPHINDLLKYLNKLADKFSKMSEEEQRALLKNLAFVASIGPIVKGTSTLTSAVSKTSKGIATFTKAIGLAKNGIGSAKGSAAILAKTMTALVSPIGLTTSAVTLFAGGMYALTKSAANSDKQIIKLNKSLDDQISTRKEAMNIRQQELEGSLREVDSVQNLYNELLLLVDANGKVKDGYQDRVNFILSELNKALGTEYQQVDGVISKYGELTSSIDLLIAKKRIELIMDKQRKDYEDAIKKEADATKSLAEAEKLVADRKKKVNEITEKYNKIRKNYSSEEDFKLSQDFQKMNAELGIANPQLEEANQSLEKARKNYKDIGDIINNYNTNAVRAQSNDIEELNEIILSNERITVKNGKVRKKTLSELVQSQAAATEAEKREYDKRIKNADEKEKQQIESSRRNKQQLLNDTISNLRQETSAIEENSPEIVAAWKNLEQQSTIQYQAALAQLPENTRQVVTKMTGVAYDQTVGVATAWANMAFTSKDKFNSGIATLPEDTRSKIEKIANSINENGGVVTKEAKKMADDVIKELDRQGETQVLGVNFTKGFAIGINAAKNEVKNVADSVGVIALKALQSAIDSHSPSKKSRKLGQNYSTGFTLGILDNETDAIKSVEQMSQKVLEATNISSNLEKMKGLNSNINQKITDATRTIFTTPNIQFNVQQMDKQNLDLAFNYINKKFGSQY